MTPFLFQRGETITLALDAVTGDPADVTAISAQLKAVPPGRTLVPDDAPIAATFVCLPRPSQGATPPGWTLSLSSATSQALSPGSYLADARLEVAGGIIITESVTIKLRQAVTT